MVIDAITLPRPHLVYHLWLCAGCGSAAGHSCGNRVRPVFAQGQASVGFAARDHSTHLKGVYLLRAPLRRFT
jgi:hypothetical protein